MKEMKYLHLVIICIFVSIVCPANNVHATFPSMEIAHYEEAMAGDRTDPEYLLINKLVAENKYTEAMSLIEKKIASAFNKSSAWMLKGMLLNEMGKYREALSALRKGYKIEARHPASQFSYCQIYRNLGSIEHSGRACKIAVVQHPDSWETHYENAQSLQLSGEMIEANKALTMASTLAPKNPVFHHDMGKNYLYLNDMDKAVAAFQKSLDLNPNHLDSMYQLAFIYAVKKNTGKSKSYLKKIIKSGERHPKVESAKGLMTLIDDDQLDKIPSKIIPSKYHIGHSQSLYESKQFGQSLIEAQTAAKLKPDDKKIQITLVRLSILLLRLGLIEKEVNNLIKLAKDDRVLQAKGYQELGDTNVMRGNIAQAKKHYEKAIILGDPYSIAKISLGELPKEGSSNGKPVIIDDYFIDPLKAWQKKGEVFDHFGMYERALAIYSEVLKMDPNNLMTKLNAAATYYKKTDYEKSIALLERILISQPNHEFIIDHHILLAKAYVKKNDEKEAVINLEKVVKLNPKNLNSILSDPAFNSLKENKAFKSLQRSN
jgi:tetratricopeptide (TPR) repeat protein